MQHNQRVLQRRRLVHQQTYQTSQGYPALRDSLGEGNVAIDAQLQIADTDQQVLSLLNRLHSGGG